MGRNRMSYTKGANIPSDCVIAAKSLVCKTNIKWISFAVYGGNPAKLIKVI